MSYRLAHPSYLPVATLAQFNLNQPGAEFFDLRGQCSAIANFYAVTKRPKCICPECPSPQSCAVGLWDLMTRMGQKVCKLTVVSQKDQTTCLDVKATDGKQPFAVCHKVDDGLATVCVDGG
jgi:hypothetical protein